MSRSEYSPGSLPSPQTYDPVAMKSTRKDSPVLQNTSDSVSGTGVKSGLNSPIYPKHFQGPMTTEGTGQVLPSPLMTPPGAQGGIPNGPVNGIPGQLPLSTGQHSTLMTATHSRSATSTPPLPGPVGQSSRPGSAPLPGVSRQGSSPLYQPPGTLAGLSPGQGQPGGAGYLSSLSGPSMPPSNARGSDGVSSPSTMMTGGTPTSPTQPPGMSPSSYPRVPSGMSLSGPSISQPASLPVRPFPWQASLGARQPGPVSPINPPLTNRMAAPPTGQVVGSGGQHLMSQPPPPEQVVPPSSPSTGPVGSAPMSKRRVYPTQSRGSTYPSPGYPGATMPPQPKSTTMTSTAMSPGNRPGVTGPGMAGPGMAGPGMAGAGMPGPGMAGAGMAGAGMPGAGIAGPGQGLTGPGQGLTPNMGSENSQLSNQLGKLTVQQTDSQPVNLLERRNFLPPDKEEINLYSSPELQKKNAKPSILCCTLNNIPENHSLLQKCKLPFGILVHPFKDLSNLPVIHSTTIVRCRSCRTYINPFVTFVESRRWRCNMCYRINEVPDEFCFDPQTKAYGQPTRRPEIKSATYEFIAPSEYMLRAPQPSSYVFAFDVSFNAIETGYLKMACQLIKENLDKIPGDSRALVGFLTFNKSVNFFNLRNDQSQPHMLIVSDLDDIFLPAPEDLLVNLKESKEIIIQFLESLPETFASTHDTQCATGAAMQAAVKLLTATGGRITIFQTTLPSIGPGALENRDEPGAKSNPKDAAKLNPATDFYKKLALDCAAVQVSVDVFLLSSQYSDNASLMCAAKYSGGCVSYFPNFHISRNRAMVEKFENDLIRYLTRKIGFEAVMRVRCTKGLSIHTFHGNFFVRSTDLLSLPNVNPDAAFGMQISIEDALTDTDLACFQSALLYTSSRGERRIRVHNLALPITKKMSDVYAGANANAIALMLSKMAVDRTLTASLGDAREALMNSIVDCLGVYKSAVSGHTGQLLAPNSLKLLPLYILSLLKQDSFRLGSTASLDNRCYAMQQFKVMPFNVALLTMYPALYSLHDMSDEGAISTKSGSVPQPPRLILSGEKLSRLGIFLMDAGQEFYIWVGKEASDADIQCLFGVPNFTSIPEDMGALPELDNSLSTRVRLFIDYLQSERTNHSNLYILRDNSRMRMKFIDKLMNDRTDAMMSYHEFLVHLQGQVN